VSGIDEQYRVPQCPACNNSHEIRVGPSTWLFPEDARIKRKLKYSLYVRLDVLSANTIPRFSDDGIQCLGCGANYTNDTAYYIKLKQIFNKYVREKKYYDNEIVFEDADNVESWGYGIGLPEEVQNT